MKLFNMLLGKKIEGYAGAVLELDNAQIIVREEDIQFLTMDHTKNLLSKILLKEKLTRKEEAYQQAISNIMDPIADKLCVGGFESNQVKAKVLEWAIGLDSLEVDSPYIDIGRSKVRITAKCSILPVFLNQIYEENQYLFKELEEEVKKVSPKVTNLIAKFQFKHEMEVWFSGTKSDGVLRHSRRGAQSLENAREYVDELCHDVIFVWNVFGKSFLMLEKYIPNLDNFIHDTKEISWKIKTPGLGEYLLKNDLSSWQDQKDRYRAIISVMENWEKMSEVIKPLKLKEAVELLKSQVYYQGPMKNTPLAKAMASCGIPEEYAKSFGITWLYSHVVPSIYPNQEKFLKDGYIGQFLDRNDPTGLLLGSLTDCCQQIGGAGANCALNGATDPSSGFFVVRNPKGVVIAQSWVWATDGGFCFDNIECRDGAWDSETKARVYDIIRDIYSQAGETLVSLWGGKVTIGKGYSDEGLLSTYKKDKEPLVPSSFDQQAYRDSNKQVLLTKYRQGSMNLKEYLGYLPDILLEIGRGFNPRSYFWNEKFEDIICNNILSKIPENTVVTQWVLDNSPWLDYDTIYLTALLEM